MRTVVRGLAAVLLVSGILLPLASEESAKTTVLAAANLILPAATTSESPAVMADPAASAWQGIPARRLALNRTPPLYDTDPPAELDIPFVEVRLARVGGKLWVHLTWRDASQDAAGLAAEPATPAEQRFVKEPSLATDRFFDAAAVMYPTEPAGASLTPSLQMGDANLPVRIYYWNAARGALLMEAQGRGTTRRTGGTFAARGVYRDRTWRVALELPALPAGVPLAFAVWNGSQQDRDGRKYFSVWHWLE